MIDVKYMDSSYLYIASGREIEREKRERERERIRGVGDAKGLYQSTFLEP